MQKNNYHNKTIGLYGEDLAVSFLLNQGYKIIDRNVKISYREIDIIAKINNITVFIEVKTRTSSIFGGAIDAIGSKKIKLLKKAISHYSIKNFINLNKIRLDFIAIDVDKNTKKAIIQHYPDIF
jgi:putative endonuclease